MKSSTEGLLSNGIQVAAYLRLPLLSVWGSSCPKAGIFVKENSLFMAYSVAQGVAVTSPFVLLEREMLSFDEKISTMRPQFA